MQILNNYYSERGKFQHFLLKCEQNPYLSVFIDVHCVGEMVAVGLLCFSLLSPREKEMQCSSHSENKLVKGGLNGQFFQISPFSKWEDSTRCKKNGSFPPHNGWERLLRKAKLIWSEHTTLNILLILLWPRDSFESNQNKNVSIYLLFFFC